MSKNELLHNIEEQMASLDQEASIRYKTDQLIDEFKEGAWQNYYEIYGFLVKAFAKGQISIEEYRQKLNQIDDISIQNNQQSLRNKLVPSYNEKAIPFVLNKRNYKKVGRVKTQSKILSQPSSIHFFKAYPDMLITANATVDDDRVVIREAGAHSESKYYKKYDLGSCRRPIINLIRTPNGEVVVVDDRSVLIKINVDGTWQTIKLAGSDIHINGDVIHPVLRGPINTAHYLPGNKILVGTVEGHLYEFDLTNYNSTPTQTNNMFVINSCVTDNGIYFHQALSEKTEPRLYYKEHGTNRIEPIDIFENTPVNLNVDKHGDLIVSYHDNTQLKEDRIGNVDGRWIIKDHYEEERNNRVIQYLPNGKRLAISLSSLKWSLDIDSGTHRETVIENVNISNTNPSFQMLPDGRIFHLNTSNSTVEIYDGEVADD